MEHRFAVFPGFSTVAVELPACLTLAMEPRVIGSTTGCARVFLGSGLFGHKHR